MTYQTPPSMKLGLTEPWIAYMFDETVGLFGMTVDAKLRERDSETMQSVHTLASALGEEEQLQTVSEGRLRVMFGDAMGPLKGSKETQ